MSEITVFDYINSLSSKKYIFSDETTKKDYLPYLVNTAFSYYPDTILMTNYANLYPNMSIKMHYDFMFYGTRKGKRFSKWIKKEKLSEDINLIANFYKISLFEAKQYRAILTDAQVSDIKNSYGGKL